MNESVSGAVAELERQVDILKSRAEEAERLLRVYEVRDEVASRAPMKSPGNWFVTANLDGDDVEFKMENGLGVFLFGLVEAFLKNPRPFAVRLDFAPQDREEKG